MEGLMSRGLSQIIVKFKCYRTQFNRRRNFQISLARMRAATTARLSSLSKCRILSECRCSRRRHPRMLTTSTTTQLFKMPRKLYWTTRRTSTSGTWTLCSARNKTTYKKASPKAAAPRLNSDKLRSSPCNLASRNPWSSHLANNHLEMIHWHMRMLKR